MRSCTALAGCAVIAACASSASGSEPPGPGARVVSMPGAAWVRLHFAEMRLPAGSFVRITSPLDGEVQELDGAALAAWQWTSAYFNGETVVVEPVGAGAADLRIESIETPVSRLQAAGTPSCECGLCGGDDRVPSSELWTARLFPTGCTAAVYSEQSCLVSAGHCVGAAMVVQFNVPAANPDCAVVNPPVQDQFPIVAHAFGNGGPGNDWAVLRAGVNGIGQTPFERYGERRPIAPSPGVAGEIAVLTGYGADCDCQLSFTQQTDSGPICEVTADAYLFEIDYQPGADGAALLLDGEIIGVATHCPCCNVATRVDRPDFAAARDALCPVRPCPWDLDRDGTVGIGDLLALLASWGKGGIGIAQLLELLGSWGRCA